MKKLLLILAAALVMACGDGPGGSQEREAAATEDADMGAGEEISPQLELDSSETRFEVDTISSPSEAHEETRGEDF